MIRLAPPSIAFGLPQYALPPRVGVMPYGEHQQSRRQPKPASMGRRSSREISTMRLACRQLHERCLTLNTGTERPL